MKNIIFEEDFEMIDDATIIQISIDKYKFDVFISDKELDRIYKRYGVFGDNQYNTVDAIIALKKLTKFLEATLDVVIPCE